MSYSPLTSLNFVTTNKPKAMKPSPFQIASMKPKNNPLHLHLDLIALAVFCVSSSAQAAVLSYEPFSAYTVGQELGSGAGNPAVSGYTGNWTDIDFGNSEPVVQSGSLTYSNPLYVGESGGSVANTSTVDNVGTVGRVYRVLDSTLAVNGTTAGARYLSFLYQAGTTGTPVYTTLALYNTSTADANRAFDVGNSSVQYGSNDYGFQVNNNTSLDGTFGARNSSVHLFVVKFDLSATAGSDAVTVWFDPTLGGVGDPTGGTTFSGLNVQFDRLALSKYGSSTVAWDEIRWGTTFNDVTIPEPSTFALLFGGLAMLTMFRRRKD